MPLEPLFVAATKQDMGKTAVTLGLLHALRELGRDVGYMKPVGQHYVSLEGCDVDEDVVLMREAFDLRDNPADMNPVTVPRNFTREYIANRDPAPLERKVQDSYGKLAATHGMLLVEGTGHAGVGSCFDMSNAHVAELLRAAVVIVTDGGIGKAIDEISLSLNLFERHGARVLGVILNKVWPEKIMSIEGALRQGLENIGTRLLGVIPHCADLGNPRMEEVVDKLKGHVLCGEEGLTGRVDHTVIAAMKAKDVLPYIQENTLVITPGDRLDNISLALSKRSELAGSGKTVSGLILTGGFALPDSVYNLARASGIPVVQCDSDTYSVATAIRNATYKIQPDDAARIDLTKRIVGENFDAASLANALRQGP